MASLILRLAPVSVIITTYNDSNYLTNAIESVLQQTMTPLEIIVIDDGSNDSNASSITESFALENLLIRFIFEKKKNGGVSSARNAGLSLATQEFVAFLDADDKMLPKNIEFKLSAFSSLDESYFGVYGNFISSRNSMSKFLMHDGIPQTNQVGVLNGGIPGGVPLYLFRLTSIKSASGFDESLKNNEDFDLIIRLIRLKLKCKGENHVGYHRNMRADSLSRSSNHKSIFNNIQTFLDKAESENYFSFTELQRRRKHSFLTLAKNYIFKDFGNFVELTTTAFNYSRPESIKEYLVYSLLRIYTSFRPR